ncbi:LamB/YcsF family protein [Algoriphagus sp.]|uniref:LamB/YcsF family protein n=1 Tax=Algoriphagus sp. TaxID=1872435 RepID=UPI0025F15638|nr:LamB/YcsF family protein [Algoriphagus sp.]
MKNLPEINCDLGEGILTESQIFPWIDTASVACGGHFGDQISIENTLTLAKKFKKKVGAHPSYPDKQNFGRKSMIISNSDLLSSIQKQIILFEEVSKKLGLGLDHIKFHGALYNDAASNPKLADILTNFLKLNYPQTPIFTPPKSQMEFFSNQKGLLTRSEVFADRAYNSDYTLVSRKNPGSLLSDEKSISEHLIQILDIGEIQAVDGSRLPVKVDTLCFHGDNPGLEKFLPKIRKTWWN